MGGCFSKDADKEGDPNAPKIAGSIGGPGFTFTNENLRTVWNSFTTKTGFTHLFKDKATVYSKICPGLGPDEKDRNPYLHDRKLAEQEVEVTDPEIADVTKALINERRSEVQKTIEPDAGGKTASAVDAKPANTFKDDRIIYKCRKDDLHIEGSKSARGNHSIGVAAATVAVSQDVLPWGTLWDRIFGKEGNLSAGLSTSDVTIASLKDSGSNRGVRGHIGIFLILNKIVKYIQYWSNLKTSLLLDMVKEDDTPLQIDPKSQQLQLSKEIDRQIKKELECEELDVAIEDRMKELGVTFAGVVQDLCTQPEKSLKNPETMAEWLFHPVGYQHYFKPAKELEAYFRCINMSIGLQKQVENELMAMIEEGPNRTYNENYLKICVSFNQLFSIIIKKETQLKVDEKTQDLVYLAVTGPVGSKDKVEERKKQFDNLVDPVAKAKARFDNIFIESQILKIRDGILDIVRNIANPMRRSLQTCLILTKVKTACIRAILSTLDDVKIVDSMISEDLNEAQKRFKDAKDQAARDQAALNLTSTFYHNIVGLLNSEITELCQMVYRDFERKQDSLDKLSSCLSLLRSHCLEIIGYYKAIDLVRVSEIREMMNSIQKETRIFRIETKNLLVDLMEDIQSYARYLAGKLGEDRYDPSKGIDKSNNFKDPNNLQILMPVLKMKEEHLYMLTQSIDCTDFGRSEAQAVENFRLSFALNAVSLVRHDLHYLKLNMMGLFEDRFSEGGIHDIWKCRYKDQYAVKDAIRFIDDKRKQFGKAAEESTAVKSRRVQINDARDLKPMPDMPPYTHEPALSVAAMRHSKFMAKAGTLAHKVEGQPSIQSMIEQYCLQVKGEIGVSVGQFKHLEIYRIVLELILEDGLSVKNNREYVLSNKFKKIGFGFAKSEGENSDSQFYVTFIFAEEEVATKVDAIPKADPDEPGEKNDTKDDQKLLYKDIFFNDASVEVNKFGVVKKSNPTKTEGDKPTAGTNPAQNKSPEAAGQPNSAAGANQPSMPGQGAGGPANQAKAGANPAPAQATGDPTKVIPVPK